MTWDARKVIFNPGSFISYIRVWCLLGCEQLSRASIRMPDFLHEQWNWMCFNLRCDRSCPRILQLHPWFCLFAMKIWSHYVHLNTIYRGLFWFEQKFENLFFVVNTPGTRFRHWCRSTIKVVQLKRVACSFKWKARNYSACWPMFVSLSLTERMNKMTTSIGGVHRIRRGKIKLRSERDLLAPLMFDNQSQFD